MSFSTALIARAPCWFLLFSLPVFISLDIIVPLLVTHLEIGRTSFWFVSFWMHIGFATGYSFSNFSNTVANGTFSDRFRPLLRQFWNSHVHSCPILSYSVGQCQNLQLWLSSIASRLGYLPCEFVAIRCLLCHSECCYCSLPLGLLSSDPFYLV